MTIRQLPHQYHRSILITALVLLAFMASCYGIGFGAFTDQAAAQTQSQSQALCCSDDQTTDTLMGYHGPMSFHLPTTGLLLIALASLAFALASFGARSAFHAAPARLYARSIRARCGSSQIFRPLVEQFASGLLHPKTF